MLAIQVIAKENSGISPELKFSSYVSYMTSVANVLSAVEAEVAKYWFFDRTAVTEDGFKASCKKIRDNFNKGGKGQGRLDYILNSARDLMYYRVTAISDGKKLDGRLQDTWLLTADQGLLELSKSIYFCPYEGTLAKYVSFSRHPEQVSDPYWKFCDQLLADTVENRRTTMKTDTRRIAQHDWDLVSSSVEELEGKIMQYWPKESTV